MSIIEISNDDIRAVVNKNNEIVVIKFYAEWCSACKNINAPFNEFCDYVTNLKNKKKNIYFYKINVDKCDKLCKMFKIEYLPSFVMLKNGKYVDIVTGGDINTICNTICKHV
jgi:thioredoxin 1